MYDADTDHLSLLTFDVRYGYRPPVSLPAIDDSMVDILTIAALLQFNPVSLDDFAACLRYGNNAYNVSYIKGKDRQVVCIRTVPQR
jgi:hypothetical protein